MKIIVKTPTLCCFFLLFTGFLPAFGAETEKQADSRDSRLYLFSSFRGNGEDGLHLAYSRDGLKWMVLNNDKSFLRPKIGGKLMRDPCVCQGPDGMFHLAWTTGWHDKGIGIAHSKDLINWSEQEFVPVMQHEPTAINCWAPEIFYDNKTGNFLIFWATTIPGRFPETDPTGDDDQGKKLNHRIYYVTTEDFKKYSDAKILYDDGFSVIDATLIKNGDKYVMILKDETKLPVAKKNLRLAFADAAEGPYGHASEPFTPSWVEGPTAVKIDNKWIVYFDEYTRNRYGVSVSLDLKKWDNLSQKLALPKGTRHGTVFAVPESVFKKLQEEMKN